jgi:hypothetical protein
MSHDAIPTTIKGFTEYIKIAYAKASANLNVYGISGSKFALITPLYNDYIAKEAIAANPDTATKGAREARDEAHVKLEKSWRQFLNESIRFNTQVSTSDKEVFGITPRDTTRTPVGVPDVVPALSIKRVGARRYEVEILDGGTGKKKKPEYAAGSYLYVAVTEPGQEPKHESEYRRMEFSSNCLHVLEFSLGELAKQANIYARYSNAHGKEGPESATETVIIG